MPSGRHSGSETRSALRQSGSEPWGSGGYAGMLWRTPRETVAGQKRHWWLNGGRGPGRGFWGDLGWPGWVAGESPGLALENASWGMDPPRRGPLGSRQRA